MSNKSFVRGLYDLEAGNHYFWRSAKMASRSIFALLEEEETSGGSRGGGAPGARPPLILLKKKVISP